MTGKLKCERCGRLLRVENAAFSFYLERGWPKCHEETMEFTKDQTQEVRLGRRPKSNHPSR